MHLIFQTEFWKPEFQNSFYCKSTRILKVFIWHVHTLTIFSLLCTLLYQHKCRSAKHESEQSAVERGQEKAIAHSTVHSSALCAAEKVFAVHLSALWAVRCRKIFPVYSSALCGKNIYSWLLRPVFCSHSVFYMWGGFYFQKCHIVPPSGLYTVRHHYGDQIFYHGPWYGQIFLTWPL